MDSSGSNDQRSGHATRNDSPRFAARAGPDRAMAAGFGDGRPGSAAKRNPG